MCELKAAEQELAILGYVLKYDCDLYIIEDCYSNEVVIDELPEEVQRLVIKIAELKAKVNPYVSR